MTAMLKLTPKRQEQQVADMLQMLATMRKQVESGEVVRLGIVAHRSDGAWSTEFSKSDDCRVDAAMLIELGMRRLGFGK